MADLKISALTASTTPLAGTEVLPIVQSSTTKQVSVANLTAGRAVAMLTANVGDASGQNSVFDAVVGSATATTGDNTGVAIVSNSTGKGWIGFNNANNASIPGQVTYNHNSNVMDFYSSGSFTFTNGNVAFATAAKGVNFTANTPQAGMTSQLMNWYEEGTWTPTITPSAGSITTLGTITGSYTRTGRLVFLTMSITITTNGTGAGLIQVTNLPFAMNSVFRGNGGTGRENANTGNALLVYAANTTTFYIVTNLSLYPGGDGNRLDCNATYYI